MTEQDIRSEKSLNKLIEIYLKTLNNDDAYEHERNNTDRGFAEIGLKGFQEFLVKYGHEGGDLL